MAGRRALDRPLGWALLLLCAAGASTGTPSARAQGGVADALAAQVEVLRTAHGVPHIYADTFEALGYALGYLQVEDYGERVPRGLLRARGELALHEGRAALDADFGSQPYYRRTVEVYPALQQNTRDVYAGFAAGVNRYLAQHPEEFAGWVADPFTGYDVAALSVYRSSASQTRRWINRLTGATDAPLRDIERNDAAASGDPSEEGSSAWALAPSRTTSGAAILLRNPHLSWDAGYWEAHAVVPGRLDFYGDFRIGAPLGIVGGFNPYLGFATTNNDVDNGQVYTLAIDPTRLDHYVLDGASVPLGRELVTRRFRNGDGYGFETRERVFTDLGPVIHRDHGRILHPADARRRGVPRRRTVPPHDAGYHARRVDRRHAATRAPSVQLHLRGRCRQRLLSLERRHAGVPAPLRRHARGAGDAPEPDLERDARTQRAAAGIEPARRVRAQRE